MRMKKRKLITKKMIARAENAHERTETWKSLVKAQALNAIYYKRKKKPGIVKMYTSAPEIKKKVKTLNKKYY